MYQTTEQYNKVACLQTDLVT